MWACGQYGITWFDERNIVNNDGNTEIYFARFDVSGSVIQGSETRVSNAPGASAYPAIASDGTNFAIAWHDMRDGPNGEIYLSIYGPDGTVIKNQQRVTNQAHYSLYPHIAWDGSNYAVVWMDGRDNNYNVYFQKVNPSGNLIGGNVRVTTDPLHSFLPEIVWNGSEYGVLWYDNRLGMSQLFFARLDSNGNKKAGSERAITTSPTGAEDPSIAWNGREYGVAWHDNRSGEFQILFETLDTLGNITHGPYDISQSSSQALSPSLVWGYGEFGLTWRDDEYDPTAGNFEIRFARLGPAGTRTVPIERVSSFPGYSGWSSLAWNGIEFRVLWNDEKDGQTELYTSQLGCCLDVDGDGVNSCPYDAESNPSGGDCMDADGHTFRGAPEINDGRDNQCPGDPGYGVADELSGSCGFTQPGDKNAFCWPAQSGATAYQVVRSIRPDFASGCSGTTTTALCWSHPGSPGPGGTYYFLVRPTAPFLGSWGQDSSGVPRTDVCP